MARQLPPLVVLRAPRGFGKTSTVAFWLRGGALDDRSALWLTLSAATTTEELWQLVHDALAAGGFVPAGAGAADSAAVHRALQRLTRRVVLVIDGLHHADPAADSELVELVQGNELLHLIVISRTERAIQSIGPATVDATVLGVPELLMTPAEAGLLASRLGLVAEEHEVAQLVADYAGWPALVRAALIDTRRGRDGRLVTDHAGAARYAGLVLADPEHDEWRDVVTALAVPDPLRAGDLPVLLDRPEHLSAAEVVLANSFTMVRTGGTARYPHGLRRALLENFVAAQPARYRDLNERLSQRRREQDEPVEALDHALRAESWPVVLAILEENWAELLRRRVDRIHAAIQALPRELVASSPRLVVARDYVLDNDTTVQAEAALRGGLLTPAGRIPIRSLTTTQRLALRFDGTPTFGATEVLLGRLDSALTTGSRPGLPPDVQRAVPELLTEWALSMLYDNDGVVAAYGFALACQEAQRAGDDAAAREAASGSALALALLGHTQLADSWSRHAEQLPAPASGLETVAAPLTRAVLDGLRLRDPSWPTAHPGGIEPGLIPLVELSRVASEFTDILLGRLDRARVALRRHAADHDGEQEEVVRASVGALEIDLALAEGRIDHAGALLAVEQQGGSWTLASRARHAFYVGAYSEALRLTEDAASYAGARPRVGLELLLIHACAAWRSDLPDVAVDYLATAVGIAADTEVLSPFLTVPRADLEAIAPPRSWTRELLERPPLAGTDTVFPEPLRSGQLSAAELRVLHELAAGRPLAHIGRRLYISESTVKTHVRRIYRKLGVANRADALLRARELFLLR